jgi:hypothetical protein
VRLGYRVTLTLTASSLLGFAERAYLLKVSTVRATGKKRAESNSETDESEQLILHSLSSMFELTGDKARFEPLLSTRCRSRTHFRAGLEPVCLSVG